MLLCPFWNLSMVHGESWRFSHTLYTLPDQSSEDQQETVDKGRQGSRKSLNTNIHPAKIADKTSAQLNLSSQQGNAESSALSSIGHSLLITEEMAEKIISSGAKNFMNPRRDIQRGLPTPKRKLHKSHSHSATPSPDIWGSEWKEVHRCENTCDASNNGKCEDGRHGEGMEVLCDLGTDCDDCGNWTFKINKKETEADIPRPIEALLAMEIKVMTDQASTVPSFLMPFTDPTKDVDVSDQMASGKAVERGLTQAMHVAMRGRCSRRHVDPGVFLDIGANFGWYSFYAAAHGCRVIAWEPVEHFRHFLTYGRQLNKMEEVIVIREHVVSAVAGQEVNMTVPGRGIWGTASVDQMNIDWSIPDPDRRFVMAISERADDVIQGDALVAKIDVEGFEPEAMRSLKAIFDNFRIENIFMEYSPGIYERNVRWRDLYDVPNMLSKLFSHGYKIAHFKEKLHTSMLKKDDWSDDLAPLDEITRQNVAYDLVDCYKLNQREMHQCWAPELVKVNPDAWSSCLMIPEDIHPKGFRSSFGHNTDIWATLEPTNFQVKGHSSLFPVELDPKEWFYDQHPGTGLGGRLCKYLNPALKIKSRCLCDEESCAEESEVLAQLNLQNGPMTSKQKEMFAHALKFLGV